jgi:hypothetical protein
MIIGDEARSYSSSKWSFALLNDLAWYRRFGDVPGISYETPEGLSVKRLPGFGAAPAVHRLGDSESLWWGNGSQSPAAARASYDDGNPDAAWIIRRLQEALELPGTASDYHFALAGGADSLYARRLRDPAALPAVEWFCWLDVQLIEARPEAFLVEPGQRADYYRFSALSRLITIYSTEGYLREALAYAEKAERFGQGEGRVEKLRERIALIEAEDEQ